MKNGKLNQREKAALIKAWDIIDKWCDWHEENDRNHEDLAVASRISNDFCEFGVMSK